MSKEKGGISIFQKYLTIWVIMCMAAGVLIGKFLPQIPDFLNRFEYAKVSIPMAILIWLMIYPMMMKVDFKSIKNVGKNPKGLFVTWITNWLIKPFTMYGIASLFFFVIFKAFITPDLATYSKTIDQIPTPDMAISMGCDVGCPYIGRAFDDNWGLPDPTGQSDDVFIEVIEQIKHNISLLK